MTRARFATLCGALRNMGRIVAASRIALLGATYREDAVAEASCGIEILECGMVC